VQGYVGDLIRWYQGLPDLSKPEPADDDDENDDLDEDDVELAEARGNGMGHVGGASGRHRVAPRGGAHVYR
jgi:hypothetical protein